MSRQRKWLRLTPLPTEAMEPEHYPYRPEVVRMTVTPEEFEEIAKRFAGDDPHPDASNFMSRIVWDPEAGGYVTRPWDDEGPEAA